MGQHTWRTNGSVELWIDAPAVDVYEAVSDVTRTSEISSEVLAADWLPGHAPGAVGARFRGRNRSGLARWTRVCEIVTATRGSSFSFRTVPERFDLSRRDSTTWSFELRPERGGTTIIQSYDITMLPSAPFRAIYGRLLPHHRDMRPQMEETLARLKRTLESGGA